jgi:hypothetical protein
MVRSLSQRATGLLVGVAAHDRLKRLAARAASACRCARHRHIQFGPLVPFVCASLKPSAKVRIGHVLPRPSSAFHFVITPAAQDLTAPLDSPCPID